MMRVLIVDDHAMYRRGVRDLLRQHGIENIDECERGNDAIEAARSTSYDAIILDISLPDRDGLDVLKQVKTVRPVVPVLMVSMHSEEQYAVRSLKAGAGGYAMKGVSADVLWTAFSKVLSGGTFVSAQLGERLGGGLAKRGVGEAHERLSDREFQVFRALAAGTPTRDIATQLGLSMKTVSTHRMNVLSKLGLSSNAELIRYAIEHGLV